MPALHPRQEIRAAVQAQLIGVAPAYRTSAQDRVFRTRVIPYRRVQLPAIAVYTPEESSKKSNEGPREIERAAQVVIEAALEASSSADQVDDALDAIALQIERAMNLDIYFGGKASDSVLVSTDSDVIEDGERKIGVIRLVYSAPYFCNVPYDGDLTIDDLKTVDVKTSLSDAVHPNNQANDKITGLDQ